MFSTRQLFFLLATIVFASCQHWPKPQTKTEKPYMLNDMQLFDTDRYVGTMSFRSTSYGKSSGCDTAYKDTIAVVRVSSDSVYCSWNFPFDSNHRFIRRMVTLSLEIRPIDLYEFETNDDTENSFRDLRFLSGRVQLTDTIELLKKNIRRAHYFEGRKITSVEDNDFGIKKAR